MPPHCQQKEKSKPIAFSGNYFLQFDGILNKKTKKTVYLRIKNNDFTQTPIHIEVEVEKDNYTFTAINKTKFPSNILRKIPDFTLDWSVSWDKLLWIPLTQTKNKFYLVQSVPQKTNSNVFDPADDLSDTSTTIFFEPLADLMFEHLGQSINTKGFIPRWWGLFTTLSISFKNIEAKTVKLAYYPKATTSVTSLSGLLIYGDGQCTAWQSMFHEGLLLAGIESKEVKIYSIKDKEHLFQELGFYRVGNVRRYGISL